MSHSCSVLVSIRFPILGDEKPVLLHYTSRRTRGCGQTQDYSYGALWRVGGFLDPLQKASESLFNAVIHSVGGLLFPKSSCCKPLVLFDPYTTAQIPESYLFGGFELKQTLLSLDYVRLSVMHSCY